MKASSPDAKSALRQRLESEAATIHRYRTRDLVTPSDWGPGRIDAIAAIVNRITADKTGIPQNFSTPLAPTKMPFLWNSPQGSWNQWRGVQQDPIKRNEAEAMGVFIGLDLQSKTPEDGLFDSTEMPLNLDKIENALQRLAPPKWPEEIFGKIDRRKRRRVRSFSPATARTAITRIPTRGRRQTSTVNASSRSDWYQKRMWAPIRGSSSPQAVCHHRSAGQSFAAALHGSEVHSKRVVSTFLRSRKSSQIFGAPQAERRAIRRHTRLSGAPASSSPSRATTRQRRAMECGRRRLSCITDRYLIFTRC